MANMIYVNRDKDDNITGLFAREQYKDQEKLPESDPEVQAFINRPTPHTPAIDTAKVLEVDKQALRDATTVTEIRTVLLKVFLGE